ncbi:MAG: methylmalonyl-CoA mutase family protein [Bacteroidales bacterium]|nr:methylmalonyl-CoA mutase family protein [Bacteroidales bacterium]
MKEEGNKKLYTEFPEITTTLWKEKIKADLKGADYQKSLVWNSDEGIPVNPFYRQEDIKDLDYLEGIGKLKYPSEAANGWLICQQLSPGKKLRETNERIKAALKGGVQAVRLQLGEIRMADVNTLQELFDGISLHETELHFGGCLSADALYTALCKLATHKGVKASELKGCLGADPLGKMAETGIPVASFENLVKLVKRVKETSPGMKVIEVHGSLIQNASTDLVEELAFSLAMASDYMAILTEKGIDPLTVQEALLLYLASGPNYFMEIAKLRAARILWAKIAEAYGVATSRARIRIHSVSSQWNMTLYDPHVNMLRGTAEAMSSILGGADLVNVLPYDYPNGKGSEFSDRLARNVQIILREEAYFDRVADPASGSYYLESLTDSLAEKAWDLFCEVESRGGFRLAFEAGWIQEKVESSRKKKTDRASSGKGRILGTNAYPNFHELNLHQKIASSKKDISDTAASTLRALQPFRLSWPFEQLRLETEHSAKRPRVLLLKYGNPGWMTARATFAGNFFACAGYEIVDPSPFKNLEEGITYASGGDFSIVVLCSSNDVYAETAPAVQQTLSGLSMVVIAGYPADHIDELKKAGIEHFIHRDSNVLQTLINFNKALL